MTGLGSGAPGRETMTDETPRRGIGWQILAIVAIGLVLRLIMAYGYEGLRGSGFDSDLGLFRYWAANLAEHGPFGFYDRGFFADYTPGYLYALWVVGVVGQFLGGIGDLIKLPAILTDVALGYIVYRMARDLGVSERRATLAGRRRDREPDHLVRLGRLGPGRQLRHGVPAAVHPRAVEGAQRAGGDPRGRGGAGQAAARDPRPDRGVRHDPARPVAAGRLRRRAGARAVRVRLGAADHRLDPDRVHGRRRLRHGGRAVGAVRALGRLVLGHGAVPRLVARAPRSSARPRPTRT